MSSAIRKRLEKHPSWPEAMRILERLEQAGFEAVLAGGCVRDVLLGRAVGDLDIATAATPDQVEGLFPHSLAIGKAFGVIKVKGPGGPIDVASFRSDGEYQDGRHPEKVVYGDLKTDVQRRDFTINGLYYSCSRDQVIDLIRGQTDLDKKRIRAIGRPEERFAEDSLRILRAVRFVAQLNFMIEEKTLAAVMAAVPQLKRLASERVAEELRRLAAGAWAARGWELLLSTKIMDEVFPELARRAENQALTWHRAVRALGNLKEGRILPVTVGWFAWIFGYQGHDVVGWLRRLKFSTDEIRMGEAICKGLGQLTTKETPLVDRLRILDSEPGMWLTQLWSAEAEDLGQRPVIEETLRRFSQLMKPDGHLPKAYLTGEDLKAAGLTPGPKMGELLTQAYESQLNGEIGDRAAALRWIRQRI